MILAPENDILNTMDTNKIIQKLAYKKLRNPKFVDINNDWLYKYTAFKLIIVVCFKFLNLY